jgi:TnpA family transposase
MRKTEHAARQKLALLREQHRDLEEALLAAFGKVLCEADRGKQSDAVFGKNVRKTLAAEGGVEALREQYEAVSAYHRNNYRPLLWPVHVNYRAILFRLLGLLQIGSATEDDALLDALKFVQEYQNAKRETVPYEADLSFAGQRWQAFVETERDGETVLDRRALEVCVLLHLAEALNRLDFYVEGSEEYPDYRQKLLSQEEYLKRLPAYCEALGLSTDGKAFSDKFRQELTGLSREVDAGFPENADLAIGKDGKPRLKRQHKTPLPEGLSAFEREVRARMPQRHLLDILRNVRHWTGFTRHFGPPSGSDPKLPDADRQYVIGTFGYGCNLGASQTANHIQGGINRHTIRRINAQHVTSENLDAGRNDIVSEFIRFAVTRFWGDGKAMIADGTHVGLLENNLLGSRHIRYDRYGKIAYHHISNRYIALFCNFISCGVWEGVYILDAFLSDLPEGMKPDVLHADTHGQSEAIFGLAALLGIKLLPRMRNWNDVIFYRPDKETTYEHIDALFSDVIDWKLIETHYHDMMRVILSIQAGRVPPSMLLKRLGVKNKKNALYRAFRELGRVQRTLFLLRYVSQPKLRRTIRAETTKIESFNDFLDWITFGGPVIKSGDPVEQAKRIKYTSLIANAIMLQNVSDLTDVLNGMIAEGYPVTPEFISRLSPYMRRHILRFGRYELNEDIPEPLRPVPIQIAA